MEKHPRIRLTRDTLHPPSTGDEARALFLPVDVPLLKNFVQVYHEHGFIEALQTVATHKNKVVASGARVVLRGVSYANQVRNRLTNARPEDSAQIAAELCQTRLWESSPIRCFAWHPYSTKIAVVGLDDIVRVYSSENDFVPLLKCKQQKNVACVAWRPMSVSELAVGCETEIIVWSVDPGSVVGFVYNLFDYD